MEKHLAKKEDNSLTKKIDFSKKKENTICSLFEVENFLCDFKRLINTIKLYHILK